jgi:hypothetical protein
VNYNAAITENQQVTVTNTSNGSISLAGIFLATFAANGTLKNTFDLGNNVVANNTLAAGASLTLTEGAAGVPAGFLDSSNGGIILVDNSGPGTVVDRLSYGVNPVSITSVTIGSHAYTESLVEGTATTATDTGLLDSISRVNNGQDTNNAIDDWQ